MLPGNTELDKSQQMWPWAEAAGFGSGSLRTLAPGCHQHGESHDQPQADGNLLVQKGAFATQDEWSDLRADHEACMTRVSRWLNDGERGR